MSRDGGSVAGRDQGGGLTSAMVAERIARGEVNDTARRTSRSVLDIVRANVLTRFNAIVGTLCAVILITGPHPALSPAYFASRYRPVSPARRPRSAPI